MDHRRRTMSPRNRRVTLMLVAVIGLFIVCVTPDAVMSTVFGLGYYDADYLARTVREFTDFLLTVNSAGNFVVYCAFNTVFRNRFRALITPRCRRGRCRRGRGRGRLDGPPAAEAQQRPQAAVFHGTISVHRSVATDANMRGDRAFQSSDC